MRTLINLFEDSLDKYSNNTLIREHDGEKYISYSYKDIHDYVKKISLALIDLDLEEDDKVSLILEGAKEWVISELSILYCGAVNVPISVKIDENFELKYRIEHSESRFIITSTTQLKQIREIKNDLPMIKKIIIVDLFNENPKLENDEILFSKLLETKKNIKNFDILNNRLENINENKLVNICYTSGTTNAPKGIMLSHKNYYTNIKQAENSIDIYSFYSSLMILPWDHSFAHTAGIYALINFGASITCVQLEKTAIGTLKNIPKNISETEPYFLLSVPALAKNFKTNIEKSLEKKGLMKLFKTGLKISYTYFGNNYNRSIFSRLLYPMHLFFDKLIYSKIRASFGKNLKFFIGGGALLDNDIQQFYISIGIPMYQGYGLSEAAPIISVNSAKVGYKIGSSGKIVKNLDLKILDKSGNQLPPLQKGEIVVKGDNVMMGYWKNKKETENTLKNGWLYTGDMGYIDNDNFLFVVGRFKSLLIGNDGEKFSPEGIEEEIIIKSSIISQIMLHNNQNKYTIAIITLNHNEIKKYNNTKLSNDEKAKTIIKEIVNNINEFKSGKYENKFPSRWLPTTFIISYEQFSANNKMLNSTFKLVRRNVEKYFASSIEFAYTNQGHNPENIHNINSIKKLFN